MVVDAEETGAITITSTMTVLEETAGEETIMDHGMGQVTEEVVATGTLVEVR